MRVARSAPLFGNYGTKGGNNAMPNPSYLTCK
ncbi:MAG: hypothetical protein QOJ42_1838 [Acidobacteriaceae bacterium]|jgi:hypothetical protein|nr:hypothetical protein [Acidobacteriaceae bacterium]MDX6456735.1 hypothetical protein [Acidobacteriaceae bacterium]MEA3007218.1 hypothetical protein [Acidobacteriaceae bacterium]